ncbi:MAG: hypothetical protein IJU55_06125 [Selenomonadaceae bacterium]|nr:hypothetical protein [Selenomonadaceae bacterium]
MELNSNEKKFLEGVYGRQFENNVSYKPRQIIEVLDLTAEEQRFFSGKNFVSPQFSVQTLYKVFGKVIPLKFNRAVHSLMVEAKDFRANFCNVGKKTVKVIFDENRPIPEIIYRNLSQYEGEELDDMLTKIMEADRRINFDLREGNLMRFSVFHTGNEEFAILVTMPQMIAGSFNAKNFFDAVFTNDAYKLTEVHTGTVEEVSKLEEPVRNYWQNILKNLPPIKGIPYSKKPFGEYREKSYREKIPADIVSELRTKAQSNKAMLMAILQTAWGFLLQAVNKVDETAFCRLILNANKVNTNAMSLNVIPIRMQNSEKETVESIINKQFRQMVISQSYSFFDWHSLQSLTANKGITFDHFVSFLNFQTEQKNYSESEAKPFGNLVAKNFWDNCGMKLGVYFQYSNANLSVTYLYDANQFPPTVGILFSKVYNLILQKMLSYWNQSFDRFIENVTEIIFMDPHLELEAQRRDERKIILDFISVNKILQGNDVGSNTMFAESAKLIDYFEGDRISGDILDKNLVFVVEGKVARSLDTGDGWYNALDIISKGGWLNETVFLDDRRSEVAAEVLTETATVLAIPRANAEHVLRKYPGFYKNFMRHNLKQLEKFRLLWLQS